MLDCFDWDSVLGLRRLFPGIMGKTANTNNSENNRSVYTITPKIGTLPGEIFPKKRQNGG